MKSNDWNVIPHINKRYEEITEELKYVSSIDGFIKGKAVRKAAIFDLLQIGELLNHVSKELQAAIGESASANIIGFRNRIARRRNDGEDKLLVAVKDKKYTDEELLALVSFQEQFFDTEIWR